MKKLINSFRMLLLVGLSIPATSKALNADIFDWTGTTSNAWLLDSNWTNSTQGNAVVNFPGWSAAVDSARISSAATVDMASNISIGGLTLSGGQSTIAGSGSLSVSTITVGAGGSGSALQVQMQNTAAITGTTINMQAGDTFNLAGNYTSSGTTANSIRSDLGTLNINGVVNANTTGSGSTLIRQNTTASAVVNMNGGVTGTGKVIYAGAGTFNHRAANGNQSGTVELGANSPNTNGTHVLFGTTSNAGVNLAFGKGEISFTGGGASSNAGSGQIITTDSGAGDQTFANRIRMSRNGTFAGSNSVTLSGIVYQGSSARISNEITGQGKTLTLNSSAGLFTRTDTDTTTRTMSFGGSGTTIIDTKVFETINAAAIVDGNGNTVAPALTVEGGIPTAAGSAGGKFGGITFQGGSVNGTGTLVLTQNFQAKYGGATVVTNGTIQMGTGGTLPVLNAGPIVGLLPTPATTVANSGGVLGAVRFNHNSTETLANSFSGALDIIHNSSGSLHLTGINFGTGTITSSGGGTLFIEGGAIAAVSLGNTTASSQASGVFRGAGNPGGPDLVVPTADIGKFTVGQQLTIQGVGTSGQFTNEAFVLGIYADTSNVGYTVPSGFSVLRMSGGLGSTVGASTTSLGNAYDSITGVAGSATGSRNVVANGGTISGTGVIGGNVQAINGGIVNGAFTINGNVVANGGTITGTSTIIGNALATNGGIIDGTLTINGTATASGTGTFGSSVIFNGGATASNNGKLISNQTIGGTATADSGGVIGGTRLINGNLVVLTGTTTTAAGVVAPGASIGTITVNGNGTISGVINIEFDGSAAQKIDLLNFGGSLNLGSTSVLNLQQLGTILDGTTPYTFATYGSAGLTGTFGTVNYGSLTGLYTVDYAFGGNNIAIVAVPEPSTIALVGMGLAGVLVAQRRRIAKLVRKVPSNS